MKISSVDTHVQAAAKQELQEVLEVCSRSFSPWFMAHITDLFARHPSAPATLGRFLPHFGADQVSTLLFALDHPFQTFACVFGCLSSYMHKPS